MNKIKRCVFDLVLFIILILIDRITKHWAVNRLLDKEPIPIIKNALEFYYLPNGNTGAAFGMLAGHRTLFLIIALVVVLVIFYFVYNMPSDRKYRSIEILLVFIAAGGAGNMIDRFMQGYVVDFIYISLINFPVFNVADMYVSICTVILAVIFLLRLKENDYEILEEAYMAPFKRFTKKNKEK
ncbi:MAG: signal peptidase II [Lachnospiraceae bacterium]|nr:signal peptidase II [Lachnospiraceae bacterium]